MTNHNNDDLIKKAYSLPNPIKFEEGKMFYLDRRKTSLEIFVEEGDTLKLKNFYVKGYGTDTLANVFIIEDIYKKYNIALKESFYGLTSLPFEERLVKVLLSNTDSERVLAYIRPLELASSITKVNPNANNNNKRKQSNS